MAAFFGSIGGVGRTTIARRFAELVTLAPGTPNVLLVDAEVYMPSMTTRIAREISISGKTLHDYIASRNTSDVEALDATAVVRGHRPESGRLFFIPASVPEARPQFDEAARIGTEPMLRILQEVVRSAVSRYQCDCVVIDCGPIVDPYTAAAATLADRVFLIGQRDPIGFSWFKTYPNQIQDRYPEFTSAKVRVIINKVHVWDRLDVGTLLRESVYVIPDTRELVYTLPRGDWETPVMLFENHILAILEKTFGEDHPELIPDRRSILSSRCKELLEQAPRLEETPRMRRLGVIQLLLPVGLLAVAAGLLLMVTPLGGRGDSASDAGAFGIAVVGRLLSVIGLASQRTLRAYLRAIHGLRAGGAGWMLDQLEHNLSSRKPLSGLLGMGSGGRTDSR